MWHASSLNKLKYLSMHVLLNSEKDGRKDSAERVLRKLQRPANACCRHNLIK
jgi:hypothetical protein